MKSPMNFQTVPFPEKHYPSQCERYKMINPSDIKRPNAMRLFYVVVIATSLTGAAQSASHFLNWSILPAVLAVAVYELGGVVVSGHADKRQRLGERAYAARFLSMSIAVGAVAINVFGHWYANKGAALFFGGASLAGYCIWLVDSASSRRDALRANNMLRKPAPAYGFAWLASPRLTATARALAIRDDLTYTDSLVAAQAELQSKAMTRLFYSRVKARYGKANAKFAMGSFRLKFSTTDMMIDPIESGYQALVLQEMDAARVFVPKDDDPWKFDIDELNEYPAPLSPPVVPVSAPPLDSAVELMAEGKFREGLKGMQSQADMIRWTLNVCDGDQSLARARLANAGVKVSPSRIQAVASRMAVK